MNVINKILIALMVIGLLWLALSTVDVMIHNNPKGEIIMGVKIKTRQGTFSLNKEEFRKYFLALNRKAKAKAQAKKDIKESVKNG